ncbi:hypothetical protein AGMMS50268_39530 [Spirochaetia bacterium]|nr:hypothetical protein AGMMS50268_39530 [Spirochaetia bacterium]
MMTIQKRVENPASYRITVDVPREMPVGTINLTFSADHPVQAKGGKPVKSMRGILKGKGITLAEFEKMQREDLLLEEGRE